MSDDFQHLVIHRENAANPRRTRGGASSITRDNRHQHGQNLNAYFQTATANARQQIATASGSYVFKFRYEGSLDFAHLNVHGVEFVSQEDKCVCVVFADEIGLAKFSDHLARLGIVDNDITYKTILDAIVGIDNWTAEDRSSWALRHKGLPQTDVFCLDVELWPLMVAQHPERRRLCASFTRWLQEQHIPQLDQLNLDSLLLYRVQVNQQQAALLLNHGDVRLVDLIPTTGLSYQQLNRDINQLPRNLAQPALGAAKICILDSGINSNHPLLRSAMAESASFIAGLEAADENGHGTAVAGIALYGDVEACNASNYWQPELRLCNARVLDANAEFDVQTIEKTLQEAVAYFAEQGCRIFNLSLGNANAPYEGKHVAGIAYVLDKLARQYDVLFVVSAGNFNGSQDPPVPLNSWREEYPDYLMHETSVIIDPAPALNVLTVGSLVRHNATREAQHRRADISELSPATENQPSPFTRHGPSVRGALKPDLVAHGGNCAVPMRREGQQWRTIDTYLGVLSCHHQFIGNTLLCESSGTSFAAPYISHLAGRLLNAYPTASANMLRAMLVNHANLPPEVATTFPDTMQQAYKTAPATRGREIAREVAGYGLIDEDALYRSSENVVVLMAEESIANDAHQFFELPLPPEFLRTQKAMRELRITLAHMPAVRTTRVDYAASRMSYHLVLGASLEEVQSSFHHASQQEVDSMPEAAKPNREISATLRSKGTVQSSVWRLKKRKPTEKWFVVVTRQDKDWGGAISLELEKYALVITVADRENEHAQLYTQIQARIALQEQQREHQREQQRNRN